MAWYTIPGLLVAILAIIQLLLDEKTSDIEGVKRDILLNLIRSVVISIPIFLVETKHRFLIILLNLIKCSQILILKGFEHFYCWKILHVSLYISS